MRRHLSSQGVQVYEGDGIDPSVVPKCTQWVILDPEPGTLYPYCGRGNAAMDFQGKRPIWVSTLDLIVPFRTEQAAQRAADQWMKHAEFPPQLPVKVIPWPQ